MNRDLTTTENRQDLDFLDPSNRASRTSTAESKSGSEAARRILLEVWRRIPSPEFSLRLWTGEQWNPPTAKNPEFTLVLHSPSAVRLMFSNAGSLSFGEAFAFGLVDVEGPLSAMFGPLERIIRLEFTWTEKLRIAALLQRIPRPDLTSTGVFSGFDGGGSPASRERHRDAINYHYDQPVEFWKAWLDESLSYSCAYFETAETSLSDAQTAKLDYICRKLRLQPGMRVLDMGCGWGAWITHAARYYGVQATGVTLSPRQAEAARERIQALGLATRCQVEIANFLDYKVATPFDRIASIGSVEHVPEALFEEYFVHASTLLRPGGQMLNHGITRSPTVPDRPGDSFMDKYVFPDHYLATIGKTVTAAEAAGFEVRDVESLREHYARTLEHWKQRLEAAEPEILRVTDSQTFRIFRLYLSGSAHEFRIGRLGLHQTLLVKPDGGRSGLPLRRSDWYRARSE